MVRLNLFFVGNYILSLALVNEISLAKILYFDQSN